VLAIDIKFQCVTGADVIDFLHEGLKAALFDPAASEPVWLGYLDGDTWRFVDGMPAAPTHWTEIPGGPEA
jgi:hypothetical protein